MVFCQFFLKNPLVLEKKFQNPKTQGYKLYNKMHKNCLTLVNTYTHVALGKLSKKIQNPKSEWVCVCVCVCVSLSLSFSLGFTTYNQEGYLGNFASVYVPLKRRAKTLSTVSVLLRAYQIFSGQEPCSHCFRLQALFLNDGINCHAMKTPPNPYLIQGSAAQRHQSRLCPILSVGYARYFPSHVP
jgi:hypothetical protein